MAHTSARALCCVALATLLAAGGGDARRPPPPHRRGPRPVAARVEGALNVHLIPESHNDGGWKKTALQYYTGSNGSQALGAVRYIYSNVVAELLADPARTFTAVEQLFFQTWWSEQDDGTREAVRGLVASRQLTFVGGGWTQFDEGCTSYTDILDQTTLGLRFIQSQFGASALPTVAASFDPFGHSAFSGSVMYSALAGMTSVFWGRISSDDMAERKKAGTMEWVWTPSPTLGEAGATLACTLPVGYNAPNSMMFDNRRCYNQQPSKVAGGYGVANGCATFIQDDPEQDDYNADVVIAQIVSDVKTTYFGGAYRSADALLTAGGDFAYENAREVFESTDTMIELVNAGTAVHGLNFFYSTMEAYVTARLNFTGGPRGGDAPLLPTRSADIFPYATSGVEVWSGYQSSRPALKGYIRDSSAALQAARQLQAWTGGVSSVTNATADPLYQLETAQATAQHHDAITGTERQHVAYDYARRLARGRVEADAANSAALAALTRYTPEHPLAPTGGEAASGRAGAPPSPLPYATCDLANGTVCPPLETGLPALLILYNSLAAPVTPSSPRPVMLPAGLPSGAASILVLGPDGVTPLPAQLLPLSDADLALRTGYYGVPLPPPSQSTLVWLAFLAPHVPGAGYAAYFVHPVVNQSDAPLTFLSALVEGGGGGSTPRQRRA